MMTSDDRLRTALALLAVGWLSAPVSAETVSHQMMRLCNSVDQSSCWIKMGSQFCDEQDGTCRRVERNTPARITRQSGNRVFVDTRERRGSVLVRSIVFDKLK